MHAIVFADVAVAQIAGEIVAADQIVRLTWCSEVAELPPGIVSHCSSCSFQKRIQSDPVRMQMFVPVADVATFVEPQIVRN